MQLADIRTYPVKALRGGSHDRADVEPWGLRGDRCWMVVDASGRFVTQCQHPRMATLQAEDIPTGLTLTDAAGDHIAVATPGERAETLTVTAWFKKCHFRVTPEIDRALMIKEFLVLGVTLI